MTAPADLLFPAPPHRFGDRNPGRGPCRHNRARERDDERYSGCQQNRLPPDIEYLDEARGVGIEIQPAEQVPRREGAQQASRHGYHPGLRDEHRQHVARGESQRLQNRNLTGPLPNGHCHRVCRDENNREDQHGRYAHHEAAYIAQHRNETQHECLFRFGLRRSRAADKHAVYGIDDGRNFFSRADPHCEHTRAVVVVPQLVQVIVPHQKQVLAASALNQSANDQLDIPREDGPLQGNPVSHVPAVALGQLDAGKSSSLFLLERLLLFAVERVNVGVDLEEAVRIDGKLRKKVCRVLINTAYPLIRADLGDTGYLPDLLAIGDRQNVGQRRLMTRQDTRRGFGRQRRAFELLEQSSQRADQKERHADAQHREDRSAPVAQRIAENQRQKFHRTAVNLTRSLRSVWLLPGYSHRHRDRHRKSRTPAPACRCLL